LRGSLPSSNNHWLLLRPSCDQRQELLKAAQRKRGCPLHYCLVVAAVAATALTTGSGHKAHYWQ